MEENPYQVYDDIEDEEVKAPIEVPKEILTKIKTAYIAGIVSGTLTLILVLISIFGNPVMGLDEWSLIDVALIFGLAFGIYCKSRICAILLFLYFILSKLIMAANNPASLGSGIIVSILFIYFYFQGILGTFQYHNFIGKRQEE